MKYGIQKMKWNDDKLQADVLDEKTNEIIRTIQYRSLSEYIACKKMHIEMDRKGADNGLWIKQ